MEDRADAFITLPGGIGTLEELFETWTAGYLGMHDKPVVMLDPVGHFDGLLTWLTSSTVDTGFVARRALDGLHVTSDLDGRSDRCAGSTASAEGPIRRMRALLSGKVGMRYRRSADRPDVAVTDPPGKTA